VYDQLGELELHRQVRVWLDFVYVSFVALIL
jgi:hypothetical protein